jgi:DNA modification methylase
MTKLSKKEAYLKLLESKIVIAQDYGTAIEPTEISEKLLPHQKDIVHWAVSGGRRAIFASFGLGKTMMQLEIAVQVMKVTGKPFLIAMPLGVVGEFRDDLEFLHPEKKICYITDSDNITEEFDPEIIYVTNYERIRKGDIKAEAFGGVSFDEASILRNLKTETTNYVLKHFGNVHYRFVATATPTPNDFIEILNYAVYLGVIDRGHALTRFFQRDSTKAGSLTLYPNKKEEFWKWVSTWAVFINKPSDLGYDDTGYLLPQLNFKEVCISNKPVDEIKNKHGELVLFKDNTKSLIDVSREKSGSIDIRVQKAFEIVSENPNENWILWHHLENERTSIEQKFKDFDLRSVFGSQTNQEKEDKLIDFKHGKFKILSTKPKIAGSGCNFQHACYNMIYVGIDYKFNDFIQGIHRCYRFKQAKQVNVYAIFTHNEQEVMKALKEKWVNHIELQTEMINIVREYGLNTDKIKTDMKRQIFSKRQSSQVGGATVYNEDTVIIHQEMPDNHFDMILTSIPFGDHYEYSDNYNDMGHNHGNDEFFKQMEHLTPNLLRTLKPGKVAAIHVKDRIRYSYQNGTGFTTIDDFSGKTVAHFTKEAVKEKIDFLEDMKAKGMNIGQDLENQLAEMKEDYKDRFYLIGKITVTTDVVRENNQTYRLGWSEQCKDATKMGVGSPEYILLFRKAPTESNNAYADEKCEKSKQEYTRANWQLDAHSYWKSSGNRFCSFEELRKLDVQKITKLWKEHNLNTDKIYSFQEHLKACEDLEAQQKLSSLFMTLPIHSDPEYTPVWTDINRMNTLNTNQTNRGKEKHICPLQIDIVERLINRFTKKGDLVCDPFGGLFTTAYVAIKMGRRAFSVELNPEYYSDGLFYLKSIEYKINVPTLFDMV